MRTFGPNDDGEQDWEDVERETAQIERKLQRRRRVGQVVLGAVAGTLVTGGMALVWLGQVAPSLRSPPLVLARTGLAIVPPGPPPPPTPSARPSGAAPVPEPSKAKPPAAEPSPPIARPPRPPQPRAAPKLHNITPRQRAGAPRVEPGAPRVGSGAPRVEPGAPQSPAPLSPPAAVTLPLTGASDLQSVPRAPATPAQGLSVVPALPSEPAAPQLKAPARGTPLGGQPGAPRSFGVPDPTVRPGVQPERTMNPAEQLAPSPMPSPAMPSPAPMPSSPSSGSFF